MYLIETQRLLFRPFSEIDAEGLFEMNNDPDVMRYTGDAPFGSLVAAKNFVAQYNPYETYGYGRWTVLLRETGEFLGWCGLKYLEDEKETDVGYRFLKKHWGKGYATEAASASLAFGFDKLKLPAIIGRVMPENVASVHVLQKLGFTFWKSDMCNKHPAHFYKMSNHEFWARQQ